MNQADIGIVGGGLAGATAAAMLGRAGISTVMIDVHKTYPEDFRVEKVEKKQEGLFEDTGFGDAVYRAGTLFDEIWLARFGVLIDKRPNRQFGIAYADLIATVRAQIPDSVQFVVGKVTDIKTSPTNQTIVLANGETWSVRLVVLATGLNNNTLREKVGITRQIIDKCHVVSVGFDMQPTGRDKFAFPALTYMGGPTSRIAYVAMFPMRETMRANMFLYRDMNDPWLQEMRTAPVATMCAVLPRFRRQVGAFEVTSPVLIRPIDLYRTEGYRQPGVVLVGDSFATSSPAAGTGVQRVLTDVTRLCNIHIPNWLMSDGMGEEKISTFYDDPVKTGFDAYSIHLANYLRSLTLDQEPIWRARRVAWFAMQAAEGFWLSIKRQSAVAKWSRSNGSVRWRHTTRDSNRKYSQVR